jgi:DNA-binding transcriptional LysR family regulator
MSLNLHLLRLFVCVARHGSFSRAAESLNISQPAVSRGVREFELQVGSRLLERGREGTVPTEAGKILLRHAVSLFSAETAAEEDLAALRGLTRGSLRIGASTTISTWFLPALLAGYHRSHPEIKIQLKSGNTAEIAELLLARELDLALAEGPIKHPGIVVQPWIEDKMVWIAAPTHRLARMSPPLRTAHLANELMIVREPGSGTRDVGRAILELHGLQEKDVLEVGGTEAIKQVVAAGMGIALVSEATVRDQLPLGALMILQIQDFAASRMLTRLSLPDRIPSAAAAAFSSLLDQAGGRMPRPSF